MVPDSLGVAVIGAGMAGRAHAAAYRNAAAVYSPVLPAIRLVSIADVNPDFGSAVARRFGYQRYDRDWQQIAAAPDVDVVSVVVANALHREIVEGLLAAGKHVLCEKPLSDSLPDARAMADAADSAATLARIGLTYRRNPAIAAIEHLIRSGALGRIVQFSGRYWCDYACSPTAPISWRYQGGPGSGALADIGSHLAYLGEFWCGDIREISGGRFKTVIADRPRPLAAVMGHEHVAVSEETEPVDNDDYAAFGAEFEGGAVGSFEVSRVATGHPNTLLLEVFGDNGSAVFDLRRPSEFGLYLGDDRPDQNGFRQVLLGPYHPYMCGGQAMDAPGVGGGGQNDGFLYQARAFLEEVAGLDQEAPLPRCATFAEGVRNMTLLSAVTQSAAHGGATTTLEEMDQR